MLLFMLVCWAAYNLLATFAPDLLIFGPGMWFVVPVLYSACMAAHAFYCRRFRFSEDDPRESFFELLGVVVLAGIMFPWSEIYRVPNYKPYKVSKDDVQLTALM